MKATTIIFLLASSLVVQGLSTCNGDWDEELAGVCYRLDQQFKTALENDEGNIYRLRRSFFYAPYADPVLLKVIYNISFADNITRWSGSAHAQMEASYCTRSTNEKNTVSFNKTSYTLGWTSSGVFVVFHPLTIHFMQIQVPYVLMQIFHHVFQHFYPNLSGPEERTLLWDGSYELPTLYINLHFTSLHCIPSEDLFNSVLSDFNSLVCLYIHTYLMHFIILQLRAYPGAFSAEVIHDDANTQFVGFSLPGTHVSPSDVRVGPDVSFYVIYVVSTVIIYAVCLSISFFLVSKTDEKGIKYFTKQHPEILKGTMIITSVFIILEIVTEFIMSIVWTVFVKDALVAFTLFLAAIIYYSPGIFSVYKIARKYHKYKNDKNKEEAWIDALFKIFIWTVSYFAYLLLYSFFPAFILAFAYPTRIITIFTFVATFMVSSTVYLTTFIGKGVTVKPFITRDNSDKHTKANIIFGCLFIMSLIYFFLFVFAILYLLVIGRASVVGSAPLAILSFLPSILLSVVTWVMKSTMLKIDEKKSQSNSTNNTDGPALEGQALQNVMTSVHNQSQTSPIQDNGSQYKTDGHQSTNTALQMEEHENDRPQDTMSSLCLVNESSFN